MADGRVTARNLANYDNPLSVAAYTREEGLRPLEQELVGEFFQAPPAAILDLGCGAGRTSVELAKGGYSVTAIDLSRALIEEARRRHPDLDFRLMDATRLELPDAGFDAALFSYNGIDCIHPLAERLRCLTEVHRVLRPGGVFLLSSHNLLGAIFSGGYFYLRGYWHALRFLAGQWNNLLAPQWYMRYPDPAGDQHLYSAPPGLTVHQLERVGFEVLAVVGYQRSMKPREIRMHAQHVHFAARKPR